MSNEDSLRYLPAPAEFLQRMKEVSSIWEIAGLPEIKKTGSRFYLPVASGSITLTDVGESYWMEFDSFPYMPVRLEQMKNSLSWTIIEGNENSIDNAIRMTDVLFMNEEALYIYVNKFLSVHKIAISDELSQILMSHLPKKSMQKVESDSE